MKCRFCQTALEHIFLDLGSAPPSNAFLDAASLASPESYFPLKLFTCSECWLVQVDEVQSHAALFNSDYVYFSSFSRSWLQHAERYVARAIDRLALDTSSLVVEIASNDGYLLQYVNQRGIPCVGIEPTNGTADAARLKGIETISEFFGDGFARGFVNGRKQADLIVGNNVLAHVPDLNDFVGGLSTLLAKQGTITMEFPHLAELIKHTQFDTVYHEHFSYFSLYTVQRIFAAHGLEIWDVEQLGTHGGSLRIWAGHKDQRVVDRAVENLIAEEVGDGVASNRYYDQFQARADRVKDQFIRFLIDEKEAGRSVVAYGAAAKGNTLINYAGIRPDLLSFVVDASPYKQGKWLPGSRIPVVTEDHLRAARPDLVVILPWNLRTEIMAQLEYIRAWGGRFVTAVPTIVIE